MKRAVLTFHVAPGHSVTREFDRHFALDIGTVIADCEGRVFAVRTAVVEEHKHQLAVHGRIAGRESSDIVEVQRVALDRIR